jgi:mannonate dehydratase
MEALGPVPEAGRHTAQDLWGALEYFLDAVVPEAEAAGVELGMHPDDPPLPQIRGLPRIMGSVAAYDRLLGLSPSSANGATFCQGNFALMEGDLPALIRRWGDRIKYVHLRDVEGSATRFTETFHDAGPTDMAACVRAYAETGSAGPVRPDHVPTLHGEDNDRPGYMVLGRLHAIGYIEGLWDAAPR